MTDTAHSTQVGPINPECKDTDLSHQDPAPPAVREDYAALEKRLDTALFDLQTSQQKLLYAHAEMENVRRRSREDQEKARKYALESFMKTLLPVKDALEKALADSSGDLAALKCGVELTCELLNKAFESRSVTEILPKPGEALDPNLHQAVCTEIADLPPNTIVRTDEKGYKLFDRLLRPAMVRVAIPPP